MPRDNEFGNWLIGRLVRLQMSKAELARQVNVSGTAVHNWCNNGTQPGTSLLQPLAEALRVDVDEIARVTGYASVPVGGSDDSAGAGGLRAEYERWVSQGVELLARIGRLASTTDAA